MQISIQGGSSSSVLDLPSHIQNRLYFAIGRFTGRVQWVSVKLRDDNAQKGGIDKHCRMMVRLKDGGEVIVEKKGCDWTVVVNEAANCVGRAVARTIRLELENRRLVRRRVLS